MSSLFTSPMVSHLVPACHPGEPVFAIGDVHGRPTAFRRALDYAAELLAQGRVGRVVLLGDLIDRGPDSLACLRLAAEFRKGHPTDLLLGNHEQFMFVDLLHPDRKVRDIAFYNWILSKGSWVVSIFPEIGDELTRIGLGMDAWQASIQTGNVLLVHAGIPAGATRREANTFLAQSKMYFPVGSGRSHPHWAWIRDGFIEFEAPCQSHYVVHGHTARDFTGAPLVGRLNLDASGLDSVAGALIGEGLIEISLFGV